MISSLRIRIARILDLGTDLPSAECKAIAEKITGEVQSSYVSRARIQAVIDGEFQISDKGKDSTKCRHGVYKFEDCNACIIDELKAALAEID